MFKYSELQPEFKPVLMGIFFIRMKTGWVVSGCCVYCSIIGNDRKDPMTTPPKSLKTAFAPEPFRHLGHALIDRLADYLTVSQSRDYPTVLPAITPDQMLTRWDDNFQEEGDEAFGQIIDRVLRDSHNLQHPRYIGHQCCPPLPVSALCDLVGNLINNASAVYEMGPVNVAMERQMIAWMASLAGWSAAADGVFTHGGTIGNLTALLAARQAMTDYDIWTEGVRDDKKLAVLVSEQCHYSLKRAVAILGLGEEAVYLVPTDKDYHITAEGLAAQHAKALADGRTPFALVANGCSTATGSYDDLEMASTFCRQHRLWLHVDGAHGASALLSPRYRHRLKGIDKADSLVWDAHKMMMVSALATAVIFREGHHSYEAFSQKASYLFESHAQDEWYNYAHRTVECTKSMIGIKLYVPLKVYGVGLFREHIEYTHDLAAAFAAHLKATPDFELAVVPESNIVCFRYLPGDDRDLNALQLKLRRQVLESEKYYIVQTRLDEKQWLRVTLIHPLSTLEDLTGLLDQIRTLAKD